MNKLRIGVLDTGVINRDFHLVTLHHHPQAVDVAGEAWAAPCDKAGVARHATGTASPASRLEQSIR